MKRKILCLLLAVCCIATLFAGCSSAVSTEANAILGMASALQNTNYSDIPTGTIAHDNAPLFSQPAGEGKPDAMLKKDDALTIKSIAIVGDCIWLYCRTESGTGWIPLECILFSNTSRAGTLPVRTADQGSPIYSYPGAVTDTVTNGGDQIEISYIFHYDGAYWGYVKDLGYVCMDDTTLPTLLELPKKTTGNTDIAHQPVNVTGVWHRVVEPYDGAIGVEETWTFANDGSFMLGTHFYYDNFVTPGVFWVQEGTWESDGRTVEISIFETNADGSFTGEIKSREEYLLVQGQSSPVLCNGEHISFLPYPTYGEGSSYDDGSHEESTKNPLSKEYLYGTWRACNTSNGASAAIHLAMDKNGNGLLKWSYGYGFDDLYTPSAFDPPYFCKYKISDGTPKLTFSILSQIQDNKLTDPDQTAPYVFEVLEKHENYFVTIDAEGITWTFRRVSDSFGDMNLLKNAVKGKLGSTNGGGSQEEEEASKEEEEQNPSGGESYAPLSNMLGKFVSINASGDGSDTLRESWTFGKGDGSFKVDGQIPFWAEYRAEMLDSSGEVYSVLDQKYFEYGYFLDGNLYLVSGPDVYGPYFIEVYNNSILIKAYQHVGSPVERYYDRL